MQGLGAFTLALRCMSARYNTKCSLKKTSVREGGEGALVESDQGTSGIPWMNRNRLRRVFCAGSSVGCDTVREGVR